MRKLALALTVASSTLLASCASTNTGGGVPTPQQLIDLVRQYTAAQCNWIPTVASLSAALIAQYYPAGVPLSVGALAIANALCAAPVITTSKRGVVSASRRVATARGIVVIPGRFVR